MRRLGMFIVFSFTSPVELARAIATKLYGLRALNHRNAYNAHPAIPSSLAIC